MLHYKVLVPTLILLSVAFSCSPVSISGKMLDVRISADSFAFPAPIHNTSWNFVYQDSIVNLLALDNDAQQILIYDLTRKRLNRVLNLDLSKERFGRIFQFVADREMDSIFLVTSDYIITIGVRDGSLLDSFPTFPQYAVNDTSQKLYADPQNKLPLYYDENGNLFMRQKPYADLTNKNIFYVNRETVFNLKNRKFTEIGYTFPSIYRSRYMGDFKNAYRVFNGKESIISFDADATIYRLRPNQQRMELMVKSTYDTTDGVRPLDTSKYDVLSRKDHLMKNPFYNSIKYDPYKKLYYRLFMGSSNSENFVDKPAVLMVMNEELKLIKEIELEGKNDWYTSFILPTGLYIAKDFSEVEGSQAGYGIKLHYNNIKYEVFDFYCNNK